MEKNCVLILFFTSVVGDPDDEDWAAEGDEPDEPEVDLAVAFPGVTVIQPKTTFCGHQGTLK